VLTWTLAWWCSLCGVAGWETPLPPGESKVLLQAVTHAGSLAIARQDTGYATGRYSVSYVRPEKTSVAFKSRIKTWFTPDSYHARLLFDQHEERASESIIIRHHNVMYSHRRHQDSRLPPLALISDVENDYTVAVTHGLLVDPGRLHLEMAILSKVPLHRLTLYQQRDGLIRVHHRSDSQPYRVLTLCWFSPAKGYLPVKQLHYHQEQPDRPALAINYEWKQVGEEWFCTRVHQIRHDAFAQNGESYTERHCEFAYDEITLGSTPEPSLFHIAALQLPTNTRIKDLRKNSLSTWLPYQPDGDPFESRLNAMLQESARLVPPTARVPRVVWWGIIFVCLIALPPLLFPGIGLHFLRIIHIPQRLAVR
jgi:hypothetical protein